MAEVISKAGQIQIRRLAAGNIAALTALWVRSWQETMPNVDFEARQLWITAFLEEAGRTTLVAWEKAPQGFVTIEPARAYLHQLVAAPEAKGTGVAVTLLGAAKLLAPGGLVLDVNQVNARAVRFYEREGFARVGAGMNETSGLTTWRMAWEGIAQA